MTNKRETLNTLKDLLSTILAIVEEKLNDTKETKDVPTPPAEPQLHREDSCGEQHIQGGAPVPGDPSSERRTGHIGIENQSGAPVDSPAPNTAPVSADMLRAAARTYLATNTKDDLVEILKKYGARNVSELTPHDRSLVFSEIGGTA